MKLDLHVGISNMLPEAIIVDIDGTISNLEHRLHYIDKYICPENLSERCETCVINEYPPKMCGKGVLAKKDWDSFFANVKDDTPIEYMLDIVCSLANDYKIVLCSGRAERARIDTKAWLFKQALPYDDLYMRKDKDHREDWVIKEELLKEIQKKYTVIAAIDDRKQVVNMWRRNGILCLQAAEGDF